MVTDASISDEVEAAVDGVVAVDGTTRGGRGALTERVHDKDFRVSGSGFWQVHPAAASTLVDAVLAGAMAQEGDVVADLYAGVGLFTAFLADAVGETGTVVSVESDQQAAKDAAATCTDRRRSSWSAQRLSAHCARDSSACTRMSWSWTRRVRAPRRLYQRSPSSRHDELCTSRAIRQLWRGTWPPSNARIHARQPARLRAVPHDTSRRVRGGSRTELSELHARVRHALRRSVRVPELRRPDQWAIDLHQVRFRPDLPGGQGALADVAPRRRLAGEGSPGGCSGRSRSRNRLSAASLPKAPAMPKPPVQRKMSTGSILLGLGALFILVAGIIFITVSWGSLGVTGRALVLLAFTAVIGLLATLITRRGLRASAEALWTCSSDS